MAHGVARIAVGGNWSLDQFMLLLRRYRNLYDFSFAIKTPALDQSLAEIDRDPDGSPLPVGEEFEDYPWRGGFSTVNFFSSAHAEVPVQYRLRVHSIKVASPGIIALWAALPLALKVTTILTSAGIAARTIWGVIRSVQKGIEEHELAKIDARRAQFELSEAQREFVLNSIKSLESELGLSAEEAEILRQRTRRNEVANLKILLGVSRRAWSLAKQQQENVIHLLPPLDSEQIAVGEGTPPPVVDDLPLESPKRKSSRKKRSAEDSEEDED